MVFASTLFLDHYFFIQSHILRLQMGSTTFKSNPWVKLVHGLKQAQNKHTLPLCTSILGPQLVYKLYLALSMLILKTLFNIVGDRFVKFVEL